jgi:xanthine dehydrogenase YagR molybdenum-binding subunit
MDGMLDGVIIRSPHAHARVTSVAGAALLVELLPPDRTVRYVGQPVAVTTREAAPAVDIQYEALPAVLTPEESRRPNAPEVYPTAASRKTARAATKGRRPRRNGPGTCAARPR